MEILTLNQLIAAFRAETRLNSVTPDTLGALLQRIVNVLGGAADSDLLELFLKPQPKTPGYVPQLQPLPGQVEVVLPCFKHKDIRTYNYLSERAEICLHACIRNRFKVALWKDLHTVGNVVKRTDVSISEWMEAHGIEDDDRNWNTIAKILQRKRAVYCQNNRLTDRKSSKHRKKGDIPE